MIKFEMDEQSNSHSIGFAGMVPLEKQNKSENQIKKQHIDYWQKINTLNDRLITSVEVITPIQIQSFSFRNQLKTYRYEKKPKIVNTFTDAEHYYEKEIQKTFTTFKDIFSEWRIQINRKFYILFNNKDLFYFFHKPQEQNLKKGEQKGGSFLVLSCLKSDYSNTFEKYGINFEKISVQNFQRPIFLLKNNQVQLFWRYLTDNFIKNPTNIELVSNFYFMNSVEVLPFESYNGKQQRPQFDHIANKRVNILGDVEKQLYLIRMQGLWLKENILNLYNKLQETFKGVPYHIDFSFHSGSFEDEQFYQKL